MLVAYPVGKPILQQLEHSRRELDRARVQYSGESPHEPDGGDLVGRFWRVCGYQRVVHQLEDIAWNITCIVYVQVGQEQVSEMSR